MARRRYKVGHRFTTRGAKVSKRRMGTSASSPAHPLAMHGLEDIYAVSEKCKKASYAVEGLSNHFVKWFGGEQGGGLFSQKTAMELSVFIKTKLLENNEIPDPARPLSKTWREVKGEYFPNTADKLGVASGTLADSIVAKRYTGKAGRWAVSVEGSYSGSKPKATSDSPKAPLSVGKITDVGVIGSLLEFGMEGPSTSDQLEPGQGSDDTSAMYASGGKGIKNKGRQGEHTQPPRPWFYPAFHLFIKERYPKLVNDMGLTREMNKYWSRLAKETVGSDSDLSKYKEITEEDIVNSTDFSGEEESTSSQLGGIIEGEREESLSGWKLPSSKFGEYESGELGDRWYSSAKRDLEGQPVEWYVSDSFSETFETFVFNTNNDMKAFFEEINMGMEDIETIKAKWSGYKY